MPGKKNIAILICLLNIHVQSLNVKIDNTIEIYTDILSSKINITRNTSLNNIFSHAIQTHK